MKRIEMIYWSDYACPFCYIGERNLKIAMKELGISDMCDLRMRAFELHPDAPNVPMGKTVELLARKYGMTLEQSMQQIKRIEDMGRDAGIQFDYENTQYTGTFDAHRLTKLAQDEGDEDVTERLIEMLFKALFEDGEVLADHETLKRIAVEAGLDSAKVEDVLGSDRFSEEVRFEEQVAARQDIHGVPYFILGNRYIVPGAMPASDMKDVLVKLLDLLGIEVPNKQNRGQDKGMNLGGCCGPNGC